MKNPYSTIHQVNGLKKYQGVKECWLICIAIVKLWFLVLSNLISHITIHPRITKPLKCTALKSLLLPNQKDGRHG